MAKIKLTAGALQLLQLLAKRGGSLRLGGRAQRAAANSARSLERHGFVDSGDFLDYRINEAGKAYLDSLERD